MVVFPSMLLGQQDAWGGKNFVLPWAVPANEFYNLQGAKFSTSEGWYLDNDDFFSKYSPDAARFHVLFSSPETADAEFTWEAFQTTNNSLLGGKLGNFASRVLKFAGKRFDGQVPESDGRFDDHEMLKSADSAFAEIGEYLANHQFKAATRSLMGGCDALNQFFDALAPWKLAKSDDADDILACGAVIERCVAYLDLLSRRFSPFCPTASAELRAMLGEAATSGASAWGDENATTRPQFVPAGLAFGEPGVLFPRIDDEAMKAEVEALQSRADSLA
jgi:methionyl-tRNA synthetase